MEWATWTPEAGIKAGMLLRIKGQGDPVLVGHVNELLGVCNDCVDFSSADITLYKYVWRV